MPTLKDITAGETRRIHICYSYDIDQYPDGKPIDPSDMLAQKLPSSQWICGECQIEELNKRKLKLFGVNHSDVQYFIQQEDKKVKAWNNYPEG